MIASLNGRLHPLTIVLGFRLGLCHMANTVGISNFSKHSNYEGIVSNKSPNPYIHFQCHQTNTFGNLNIHLWR